MENLIFSLNATAPVFLMMLLGMLFRRLGWIDEAFASKMNRFVFLVPLPVLVFHDLASAEIGDVWNFRFVAFCFLATAASIAICALLSCLLKEKPRRGEFIQASYRSSAALLGIALTTNIYGDAGLVPLMIIGSVPLYNVMAVVVLSLTAPDEKKASGQAAISRKAELWKRTLKGIVTNPIILGILLGLLWSMLRLPLPPILEKTVTNLGDLAAPLGLMAMGATFRLDKAVGQAKPAIAASFIKLVGFCVLFLPIAVRLGFREEELVAILIMLGSATTVSCYVMAKGMGHEGVLTSSAVMLTTLFSAFTITGWLFLLKSFGLV
ncbi:MAG TPA: AEC family transporter [Candidatus Eisenbergiella stercorigallinarum]|uniref:AEC family transporter n=1 Tax=Candidatus Eisenbergiella stercorigallinarum TaxID=2838557 RepID=A0A9D2R379_9FIRM|nr:AEC family transporter [Candidatus Eisenbergiella stercorigallinarum]